MNTPIIDAIWGQCKGVREYHAALEETAKRLEADRAELIAALERATSGFMSASTGYFHIEPEDASLGRSTLAKVKANFPTP